MNKKKTNSKLYTILSFLLVVGILGFINYISTDIFFRTDYTQDKLYELAPATLKLASKINDIVQVEAYFSDELPPQLTNVKTNVKDFLKEFRAYSKNKLSFKFIDPKDDNELYKKINSLGIPTLQVNIMSKDEQQIKKCVLGLLIRYQGKKEVIPVIQSFSDFEYNFDISIKKLIQKKIPEVALYIHKDDNPLKKDEYKNLKRELEKQYKFKTMYFDGGKTVIPGNYKTIIIASPENLSKRQVFMIDQYIMNGGNVIFLVNKVNNKPQTTELTSVNSGLEDYFKYYGIILNDNTVGELTPGLCHSVSIGSRFMRYVIPYKFFVKTVKQNLDFKNPMLSKFNMISFQWPSSISIIDKKDTSYEIKKLIQTTKNGIAVGKPFDVNPRKDFRRMPRNQYTLAVWLKGKLTSFFNNKSIPDFDSSDTKLVEKIRKQNIKPKNEYSDANILLVAESDFIKDDNASIGKNAFDFILNAVEYFSSGNDLISIRSRGNKIREFEVKEMSDFQRNFLKFFCIAFMSILLIAFGILRYFWKRR